MHVHCLGCKHVQISYIIRSHIDQNTQDSGLPLEIQRKMDFHTKKRDRSYKEKRLRSVRKKAWRTGTGMVLQEKGMAQRHAKRA